MAIANADRDRHSWLGIIFKSYTNEELDDLTDLSERIRASALENGRRP